MTEETKTEAVEEKAPRAPRKKTKITYSVGKKTYTLNDLNDAELTVGTLKNKEGSKRAERAKALEGCKTVQDYLVNDGLVRDLNRYLLSGAVTLTLDGKDVTITSEVIEPVAEAESEAA